MYLRMPSVILRVSSNNITHYIYYLKFHWKIFFLLSIFEVLQNLHSKYQKQASANLSINNVKNVFVDIVKTIISFM